jgi:hypothetical protein
MFYLSAQLRKLFWAEKIFLVKKNTFFLVEKYIFFLGIFEKFVFSA